MPPATSHSFQCVVLAGGDDRRLHPLTSSCVKALLPVGNKPMLSYSLKVLHDAGVPKVFVVVMGEDTAKAVQDWASKEYPASSRMQCEIIKARESQGTADALRVVADKITSKTVVVMSGDLLTDFPVNTLVAKHQMDAALATVLLFKRKVSPTTQTKPGTAPKHVDYIGLDGSGERLLFYAPSHEALKDFKVPLSNVREYGSVNIASDLVDAHLYVFDSSVLKLLDAYPNLSSVRQDLLPFLTQQRRVRGQFALPKAAGIAGTPAGVALGVDYCADSAILDLSGQADANARPGFRYMEFSHQQQTSATLPDNALRVHVVQQGLYCARIADAASFCDVNKDLADSRVALHLTGLKASSQHENVVPASTMLGNKCTIAAACILGENCTLGDKTSIKRSVLGSNCKLGANVKIINSVLQDNVVLSDGVMVQNTIICAGAVVKEKATLKDCQVGASFTVSGGRDYNGEVLCSKATSQK